MCRRVVITRLKIVQTEVWFELNTRFTRDILDIQRPSFLRTFLIFTKLFIRNSFLMLTLNFGRQIEQEFPDNWRRQYILFYTPNWTSQKEWIPSSHIYKFWYGQLFNNKTNLSLLLVLCSVVLETTPSALFQFDRRNCSVYWNKKLLHR